MLICVEYEKSFIVWSLIIIVLKLRGKDDTILHRNRQIIVNETIFVCF